MVGAVPQSLRMPGDLRVSGVALRPVRVDRRCRFSSLVVAPGFERLTKSN